MGWTDHAKTELRAGRPVQIRPKGNSMLPLVKSGALVTLDPVTETTPLAKGDIVLVHVSGHDYLHLIKAERQSRYQIGNNRGRINGWVGRSSIYGKTVEIDNSAQG
jgi:phage repressor protein C with HTH and peptisase S24 domain